jgi:hypothetical protein
MQHFINNLFCVIESYKLIIIRYYLPLHYLDQ